MAQATHCEKTEGALKYQIGRQAGMKRNAMEESQYFADKFFQAIKAAFDDEDTPLSVLEKMQMELWDWVEKTKPYKSCPSKLFEKKTVIKPYENKKGNSFLAHFTPAGNYIGKVSDLGDVPVYFDGLFPITKFHYRIACYAPEARNLKDFFQLTPAAQNAKKLK
jgi:hypothetical protein